MKIAAVFLRFISRLAPTRPHHGLPTMFNHGQPENGAYRTPSMVSSRSTIKIKGVSDCLQRRTYSSAGGSVQTGTKPILVWPRSQSTGTESKRRAASIRGALVPPHRVMTAESGPCQQINEKKSIYTEFIYTPLPAINDILINKRSKLYSGASHLIRQAHGSISSTEAPHHDG